MFNSIEQGKQEIEQKKQNLTRVQQSKAVPLPKVPVSVKTHQLPLIPASSVTTFIIPENTEEVTLKTAIDLEPGLIDAATQNSGPSYEEYMLLKATLRENVGYSEETVSFLEGPQGGIFAMIDCSSAVQHLKEAIKEVDPALLEQLSKKRRPSIFNPVFMQ